jgi:hypothetical protein
MVNKKLILLLSFLVCLPVIFWWVFLNSAYLINDASHRLTCENRLKAIAQAIELYRADWDEAFPPSLLELNPYIKGKYNPGPKRISRCSGNRDETGTNSSRQYVYQPPLNSGDIVPICWDGKPHHFKGRFAPDMLLWNVLYSDGHVDRLHYDEFLKEMARVAAKKPDVLTQIQLPERPKRGPRFLFGLIVGIAAGYFIWGRKKKKTTTSESP